MLFLEKEEADMRTYVRLFLTALLAAPLPIGAKEVTSYETDVDFVRREIETSFEHSIPSLDKTRTGKISIVGMAEGKSNWLVEGSLKRVLLNRGYRVVEANPDSLNETPETGRVLSYRLVEISLNCFRKGRIPLRHQIERQLRANCFLQLTKGEKGPVIWADWVKVSATDSIPEKYSQALETKGPIDRRYIESGGKKMEIIASLAVTGSLVYLLRESRK